MPLSRLLRFLLTSVAALLVLIVPWYFLAHYLAAPVVAAAGQLMQWSFVWVEGVERQGTVGTLLTTLNVLVPQGGQLVVAQLAPEVDYRSFGYGLVLFWALMLASWPRALWLKMAVGTACLVPSQAISMCFRWMRHALLDSPQSLAQAGLPRWALEVIAFGSQFGYLMLTPLVPVLLWLALDRRFVQQLWVEMSLAGAMASRK